MQVYVAGSGHDITYFQNDWRSFADVELVGTINKDSNFNHTHTENSSHHLVALSTNSDETLGTKSLNISNDFWVILYSTSPTMPVAGTLDTSPLACAIITAVGTQGAKAVGRLPFRPVAPMLMSILRAVSTAMALKTG